MGNITWLLADAREHIKRSGRPLVTLSYAQSLDGSIALERGSSLPLSCPDSRVLTHRLRAAHDAIIVGIGTVLADNPRLTVRLAPGTDPQPVVLDSHLRFPRDAAMLKNRRPPWIATTNGAGNGRSAELQAAGAHIISMPPDERDRVDIGALLEHLALSGISTVMVEGGARVITSFLARGMVDRLLLTVAPSFIGGLHALEERLPGAFADGDGNGRLPALSHCVYEKRGRDLIIYARLSWEHR